MHKRIMKAKTYGHRFGDKIVAAVMIAEAEAAIKACTIAPKKKASRAMKDSISAALISAGWPGKVGLDTTSKISITSLKNKIGLCFQTGNMGRMYADLIKLQAVYLKGSIDAGIFILPDPACRQIVGRQYCGLRASDARASDL